MPTQATHAASSLLADQKHLTQSNPKHFPSGASPPLNFSSKRDSRFEENLLRSERIKRDDRNGAESGPDEAMEQDEHVNVEID